MVRFRSQARWALPLFVAVSCLLHGSFWVFVLADMRLPDLQIAFEVPMDVELGMTDAVAMQAPSASQQDVPEAKGTKGDGDDPTPAASSSDAGTDTRASDAGSRRDAGPQDAGPQPLESVVPTDAGSGLPPGAQIAVRVDMQRIRSSPIAEDVRGLLAAIPDWKALLDGSGIDPVDQIDRLLLATPNLQRSRIVIAGRYNGTRESVEQAVARLASARGVEAPWRTQQGVPVATWANQDATARVLALIGPQHFSISREEDLPRLLAIASARRDRSKGPRRGSEPDRQHPAEALLSMPPDAGLSLEVEGVRQFVRRGQGVPSKLRVAAVETPETAIRLEGRWEYDDASQAEQARVFWDQARRAYANNTLVSLLGLSGPLTQGSIVREGAVLDLQTTLTVRQTRLILGYVRELVTPPPPLPPLRSVAPNASTGATP